MRAAMRLFIGVPLSIEVKAALDQIRQQLQECGIKGRFVSKENFHITLEFIGDVDLAGANKLGDLIGTVAEGQKSFSMKLLQLGGFGGQQDFLRVLWASLQGETELLAALQLRIGEALNRGGFPVDCRPYRPHITLARDVRFPQGKQWQDCLKAVHVLQGQETIIAVDRYCIFSSEVYEGRRIYEMIREFPLQKAFGNAGS